MNRLPFKSDEKFFYNLQMSISPRASPAKTQDRPLYDVVRSGMLEKLRSGDWAPGARLPTEIQLAEQFSVSIGTVRKAIEDLVAERVLLRRARIGTTVAVHTDEHVFGTFFNYVDDDGDRISATAELLAFEYWPVDVTHAGLLGIKRGQIALRIDNLRLSKGRPAMLDRILVSRERFPGITRDIFAARNGSIYGLYQSIASTTVVLIREEVSAVAAPAFAASALCVELGTPILQVCRRAFSYGEEVVEYRDRFVNPAVCRYKNEVGLKE